MLCIKTTDNIKKYPTQEAIRKCRYCSGFLNPKRSVETLKPWDTVLYESDNFVVVPSLVSLIEGWLLIISKEHFLCIGALPPSLEGELKRIIDHTMNALNRAYGPPTLFEHGPTREGLSIGCGIDHAHFHLVPLSFSLLSEARESPELREFPWFQSTSNLSSLQGLYRCNKSYIYIKEPSVSSFYCIAKKVPCQCLQRIIGRKLSIKAEYSYNSQSFLQNVEKTIRKLRGSFF